MPVNLLHKPQLNELTFPVIESRLNVGVHGSLNSMMLCSVVPLIFNKSIAVALRRSFRTLSDHISMYVAKKGSDSGTKDLQCLILLSEPINHAIK